MPDNRKDDLLGLKQARSEAPTTKQRENVEKVIHKINSESKAVREMRGLLVEAVRHNDINGVKYLQDKIRQER